MEELKNNSIQLIITSPPYGKIKDYGLDEQIGYYDSFEEYFQRLNNVWRECYRVLEPNCRMIINIGDQYLRTTKFGRYHILSISSRIIKDCIDTGFDFLGDIIWQKISTTNTTGGCSLMGSIYYPRNGLLTFDYEHILIFKKYEGRKRSIDFKVKELSKISLSEWKKWYVGHWRFPGIVQKEHIAMFPEELPYRVIRMFSFIGDRILDPFVGSGTTLKIAKSLFRKSIGYEINDNFKPVIENKVKEARVGYIKDFQYLLYILFCNSMRGDFNFVYEDQKQKGIIILQDKNKKKIVLDYLLIENNNLSQEEFDKVISVKIEENTIQNYLKQKSIWKTFLDYIIIVNCQSTLSSNFIEYFKNYLKKNKLPKKIRMLSLEDILSEDFKFENLFS